MQTRIFAGSLRLVTSVLLLMLTMLLPRPVLGQTTYNLAANESKATYYMEHPAHDWDGTSTHIAGAVVLGQDNQPEKIEVRIPVTSFDSGNRNRDSHMAETVEFYIFPDVSFTSNNVTIEETHTENDHQVATWRIDGELTFHGATHPLTCTTLVNLDDGGLEAQGSFEIKLTDYDIELPSLLMVKVKDWLKLDFDFIAHAQSGT